MGSKDRGWAMANEDHVAQLEQGVAVWNMWRDKNESVVPNLSGAKLERANLYGANLSVADLSDADLSGANLVGANLSVADLSRAELDSANLSRADLTGANLSGANLVGANLRGANLIGAILSGADLSAAILGETFFTDVDLNNVIGLDTCRHWGPSSIDQRTLQKSPNLPLVFLRGVGLPDRLIDYLPSLLNQPIQFYSCFISYSVKDEDVAARLMPTFKTKGCAAGSLRMICRSARKYLTGSTKLSGCGTRCC